MRYKLLLTLFFSLCPVLYGSVVQRVEWLYFKPTMDQSHFAISSINNTFEVDDDGPEFFPHGKRHINNPSFHSGVRLEEKFCYCDNNSIDLRLAYFRERHTASVTGPFLFDTIGFPGDGAQRPEDTSYNGTATYTEKFTYWGVDGTFNRQTQLCYCEDLYFLLGLHFACVKVDEKGRTRGFYIDDEQQIFFANKLNRHSRFWGIGPQLGVDYLYEIPWWCKAFALRANARAALLASHTRADFQYITPRTGPVGVSLKNEGFWRITPAADVKVGILHFFRRIRLEFGYELIWYYNAIDNITGYDVAFAGDSIDLFSSFNLQGPYIAAGVTF